MTDKITEEELESKQQIGKQLGKIRNKIINNPDDGDLQKPINYDDIKKVSWACYKFGLEKGKQKTLEEVEKLIDESLKEDEIISSLEDFKQKLKGMGIK